MRWNRSKELMESAKERIPGGVNSPVRAFKKVGATDRLVLGETSVRSPSRPTTVFFGFGSAITPSTIA